MPSTRTRTRGICGTRHSNSKSGQGARVFEYKTKLKMWVQMTAKLNKIQKIFNFLTKITKLFIKMFQTFCFSCGIIFHWSSRLERKSCYIWKSENPIFSKVFLANTRTRTRLKSYSNSTLELDDMPLELELDSTEKWHSVDPCSTTWMLNTANTRHGPCNFLWGAKIFLLTISKLERAKRARTIRRTKWGYRGR